MNWHQIQIQIKAGLGNYALESDRVLSDGLPAFLLDRLGHTEALGQPQLAVLPPPLAGHQHTEADEAQRRQAQDHHVHRIELWRRRDGSHTWGGEKEGKTHRVIPRTRSNG